GCEPRRQRRLAREIEIARMLDHRAERDVAETLAPETVTVDETAQHGAHHVLVRAFTVRGVRAAERYSHSAHDRDAPSRLVTHPWLLTPSKKVAGSLAEPRRSVVEVRALRVGVGPAERA